MSNKFKHTIRNSKIIITPYRFIRKTLLTLLWYPKVLFYRYEIKRNQNIVLSECFVFFDALGKFRHNNWGDDINKYFMEYITNKKFIFIPYSETFVKPKDLHYSMIGSIIGNYSLENTIIYGSGLINKDKNVKGYPKSIISVRGPLTREALIKKGISCPQSYGDPVLLLPLFYKPKKIYDKKIGIIPNIGTKQNVLLEKLLGDDRCVLIDMRKYNNWNDIVDQIASCDIVISESLHGLIVAETYKIPSLWVEFKEHDSNWSFKFNDFYESIHKMNMEIVKVDRINDIENLISLCMEWKPGVINYKEQLDMFPFDIRKDSLLEIHN